MPEHPIARWSWAGIEYGVAGLAKDDGALVVVIAAIGPGTHRRTTHQIRPNDAGELAHQVTKWNAATNEERAGEAERLLAGAD